MWIMKPFGTWRSWRRAFLAARFGAQPSRSKFVSLASKTNAHTYSTLFFLSTHERWCAPRQAALSAVGFLDNDYVCCTREWL
jgi:hypothetical protein